MYSASSIRLLGELAMRTWVVFTLLIGTASILTTCSGSQPRLACRRKDRRHSNRKRSLGALAEERRARRAAQQRGYRANKRSEGTITLDDVRMISADAMHLQPKVSAVQLMRVLRSLQTTRSWPWPHSSIRKRCRSRMASLTALETIVLASQHLDVLEAISIGELKGRATPTLKRSRELGTQCCRTLARGRARSAHR